MFQWSILLTLRKSRESPVRSPPWLAQACAAVLQLYSVLPPCLLPCLSISMACIALTLLKHPHAMSCQDLP